MQTFKNHRKRAKHSKSVPAILNNFFGKYQIEEVQKEIWNLMIAYAGQNAIHHPISRSNTTFFCANISLLLNQLHDAWGGDGREIPFKRTIISKGGSRGKTWKFSANKTQVKTISEVV